MKAVEKKGRTVSEAVASALEELGVPRDQVTIEVLDEPNKGLFGIIGGKDARVRVTWSPSLENMVRDFTERVAAAMGLTVEVETHTDEEYIYIDVNGAGVGMLIGHHGQTLEALQYLINLAASRNSVARKRVILDVEGYRKRREETLRNLASRMAERVRRSGQTVTLEPMIAQERRVIHLTLQDHPEVETRSEGEDPFRKIIISRKA